MLAKINNKIGADKVHVDITTDHKLPNIVNIQSITEVILPITLTT